MDALRARIEAVKERYRETHPDRRRPTEKQEWSALFRMFRTPNHESVKPLTSDAAVQPGGMRWEDRVSDWHAPEPRGLLAHGKVKFSHRDALRKLNAMNQVFWERK